MKKCSIWLTMILVFMLLFSITAFADTGTITGNNLRIRQSNSTDSKIIGYLKKGNEVNVLDVKDKWYNIEYNGINGWIYGDYIEVAKVESNIVYKIVNVSSTLNVRSGPGSSNKIVSKLKNNDKVQVLETQDGWDKVKFENIEGWVSNTYLILDESSVNTFTILNSNEVIDVEENKEEYKTVTVSSVLNVRSGPSSSYDIIGRLKDGDRVQVFEFKNGWDKIKFEDIDGWVLDDYLVTPISINSELLTTVNVVTLNSSMKVREEPNNDSSVITTLSKDTMINVISEENGWYKIRYNLKYGYINSQYASKSELYIDNGENANENSINVKLVNEALKYLGYKYVWGGKTPSGFDCSGLVYYVYHDTVPDLGRSGPTQYNYGVTVPKDQLIAGDLIYFSENGKKNIKQPVAHVGIYIGDGIFVHAANTKRGVVLNSIKSGYYYENYLFSKRVL